MTKEELRKLKAEVLLRKGQYGLQRLEKALDEIPNLSEMFSYDALRDAFLGDNAKALMTMDPASFQDYATNLPKWHLEEQETKDRLKDLSQVKGFSDVPYLDIDKKEQGQPIIPHIAGHEGRHRSMALTGKGAKKSLVQLLPRTELREPLPRREQGEYIDALRKELAMTKNMVTPEKNWDEVFYRDVPRSPRKLPDVYAKGGSIHGHVVDSEGNPLTAYHGTSDEFDKFQLGHPNRKDAGWLGDGIYSCNSPKIAMANAKMKAKRVGGTPKVMSLHVNLQNPYYATLEEKGRLQRLNDPKASQAFTQALKDKGHDGVIWKMNDYHEYVAFDPDQVKILPQDDVEKKAKGGAIRMNTDGQVSADGGVVPGSFAGSKTPDIEKLAKLRDKFIYHSGTSDDLANMKWGIEPQHGDWIKELAEHQGVARDEILNRATPLVWMSDNPNWVVMKVARKLKKHPNEVTENEIRKFGHVALIPKKGDHSEHIWKVGEEGLGNGTYSDVINLNGKKAKAYETDLYSNDMEGNKEPFGVERNEYISARPVEPMFHLVGDDLLHFLKKCGVITKATGGIVHKAKGGEVNADKTQAFMDDYLASTRPHPFNDNARIHGENDAVSELSPWEKQIHLSDIMSLNPNGGGGTRALKEIKALSDKHGVPVSGIAKTYHKDKKFISSTKRLLNWYEKHGFKNLGGDDDDGYDIEYTPSKQSKSTGGAIHKDKGGEVIDNTKSKDWVPHPENDLLQPIGSSKMIGGEEIIHDGNDFKCGLSTFLSFPSNKKSYRYLYHDETNTPVGAMQIMTDGPRSKKAVIRNLYVAEKNRREGIASKLLKKAREDFDVRHSTDLTSMGKSFAKAVKKDGGRVEGLTRGGPVSLDAMRLALLNVPKMAKGGEVEAESIPAAPGTTPIKEGHVRLYHQTDGDNLQEIEKHGLLLKHAKGIEGPRAIYAGETPFYGKATHTPTLEFQVPKDQWQPPFVLRDVKPEDFIAAHYPWHRHARYLEKNNMVANVLSGKYDKVGEDETKAVNYLKRKYAVKKNTGGNVSLDAMKLALLNVPKMAEGGRKVSPIGFYSPAAEAAANLPQSMGSPEQMGAMLAKSRGVTDEMQNSGYAQKVATPKVSKQDLVSHFESEMPDVQETVLGTGNALTKKWSINSPENEDHYDVIAPDGTVKFTGNDRDSDNYINQNNNPSSKYDQYTLPGGENYREVLLHLPALAKQYAYDAFNPRTQTSRQFNSRAEAEAFANKDETGQTVVSEIGVGKQDYRSSHWDQPNVLAHIRLNDRTDKDGKKVLFVEEIQSDWAQEGRKRGFEVKPLKSYTIEKTAAGYVTVWDSGERSGAWDSEQRARAEADRYLATYKPTAGVPTAPFVSGQKKAVVVPVREEREYTDKFGNTKKRNAEVAYNVMYDDKHSGQYKSRQEAEAAAAELAGKNEIGVNTEGWLNLALKRIAKMAVDGGYDKVAFVNGDQSADRYDLSKQVNKIVWNEKTGDLAAQRSNGDTGTIKHSGVTREKLADIIGKEPAQKILDAEEYSGWRSIEGDDLKIGGEGMKKFYDQIVPAAVNKLLPRIKGKKLETVHLVNQAHDFDPDDLENATPEELAQLEAGGVSLHQPGFEVTPEMREHVKKGLPIFKKGGVMKGYAAGGQVSLDAMRLALLNAPKMAEGGQPPDRSLTNFGLYSRAAEAARSLAQEKGTPQQMLAMLKAQKGVKQEELRLSNPDQAFSGQKIITRDQLAQHFDDNLPKMGNEVRHKWGELAVKPQGYDLNNYRESNLTLEDLRYAPLKPFENRIHYSDVPNPLVRVRMQDRIETPASQVPKVPKANATFVPALRDNKPKKEIPAWDPSVNGLIIHKNLDDPEKWTLSHVPSGVSVMDGISFWAVDKAAQELGSHMDWNQDKDAVKDFYKDPQNHDLYNIYRFLAEHIQKTTRRDLHSPSEEQTDRWGLSKRKSTTKTQDSPKKHLLIDELQSDWGQKGREQGFKPVDSEKQLQELQLKLADLDAQWKSVNNQMNGYYDYGTPEMQHLSQLRQSIHDEWKNTEKKRQQIINGIPHAPYVTKTDLWVDLGLKKALMEAAHGGYDTLTWTPGEVQAKRYPEVAHEADNVFYYPKTKKFVARRGLTTVHEQDNMTPEKLSTLVGNEVAKQLLSQPIDDERLGYQTLQNQSIRIAPREAGMRAFYEGMIPKRLKEILTEHEPNPQFTTLKSKDKKINGFPALVLTPELREKIKKRGFPAFEKGGIVRKAVGGTIQGTTMPTLAQMKMALMKPTDISSIGAQEAPSMSPKVFVSPDQGSGGMPIGGVDLSMGQQGQQLMAQPPQQPQMQPQNGMQPQGGPQPPQGGLPAPQGPPQGPQGPQSNMLELTPQGQMMGAMKPQGAASGGSIQYPTINPAVLRNQDDGAGLQPTNWMSGGDVEGMAGGGSMKFVIHPAKETANTPENFTPYDDSSPSIKKLTTAFNEAIAHHLSLSQEDRVANSQRAANAVAKYIGRTSNNKPKDLLGKNAKLIKSEKGEEEAIKLPDGRGIETTGLALSPAYQEKQFQTCPNHAACKAECLGKTSGNYFRLSGGQDLEEFKGPRLNSLLKTQAFLRDPHSFAVKLHDEIQAAKDMAAANNNHLGVRLNVLSDIAPAVHEAIIKAHPDVTFYDYTKNKSNPIAPNHHYTYSSTGVTQPGVENPNTNWKQMRKRLDNGDNVAMAFSHKEHLPQEVHDQETGKLYKVIDGDSHDFRPLDIQPEGSNGVIVGLKNKKATGKVSDAHKDSKGFFVHYDPQLKMNPNGTYERSSVPRLTKEGKPKIGETIPQNRRVNIIPQEKVAETFNNDGEKE